MNYFSSFYVIKGTWVSIFFLMMLVFSVNIKAQPQTSRGQLDPQEEIFRLVDEITRINMQKIILEDELAKITVKNQQLEARDLQMKAELDRLTQQLQYLESRYYYFQSLLMASNSEPILTVERRIGNRWEFSALTHGVTYAATEFNALRIQFMTSNPNAGQQTYFLDFVGNNGQLIPGYNKLPLNVINGKVDQLISNIQLYPGLYFLRIVYRETNTEISKVGFTLY